MASKQVAYPEWTDFRSKSGLDPLGMQNSSIVLYQRLLPGISNVTLRMRYYGLYAWLAREYAASHQRSVDPEKWRQFLRRSEALYALAAVYNEDQSGVAGSRWARRILEAEASTIRFSDNADPDGTGAKYLKQSFGAYGAAYGSQLRAIGVIADGGGHEIPLPSEQFGDALATAFEKAIGDAADLFRKIVTRGSVKVPDLEALSSMTPSNIGKRSTERAIYEELLFARGKLQGQPEKDRRDTLLLLLRAAEHLNAYPYLYDVRWLLYAACSEDGRQLQLNDEGLENQRRRWSLYQANDLLHFSYETLLKFALNILETYPSGIALNELVRECVAALSKTASSWPQSWADFRRQITPTANAATAQANGERSLTSLDGMVADASVPCRPASAWAALQLLAIIDQRLLTSGPIIHSEFGSNQTFHSLATELAFLSEFQSEDFSHFTSELLQKRILSRHFWVAQRKLRYQGDYTFLFEFDDGRVRLRTTTGPVFTNPRLGPAVTFLEDIHLIDEDGLTALGQATVSTP